MPDLVPKPPVKENPKPGKLKRLWGKIKSGLGKAANAEGEALGEAFDNR